jgi:hypothetical protein
MVNLSQSYGFMLVGQREHMHANLQLSELREHLDGVVTFPPIMICSFISEISIFLKINK